MCQIVYKTHILSFIFFLIFLFIFYFYHVEYCFDDFLYNYFYFLTVATEIAMGRRIKKRKLVWKEIWSRHHSYSGKLWKTIKIRQVYENLDFGFGSQFWVGKVLASYNACPRTVPLIKNAKSTWFSKRLFPPKITRQKNAKRKTKYFFNFLGPTRIDLDPTYSHSKW